MYSMEFKMFCIVSFYVFKQKTAYEWRISDWSSDVCSSDLLEGDVAGARTGLAGVGDREQSRQPRAIIARWHERWPGEGFGVPQLQGGELPGCFESKRGHGIGGDDKGEFGAFERSEEHTSELQSLMRISYAVFCLTNTQKENSPIQACPVSN